MAAVLVVAAGLVAALWHDRPAAQTVLAQRSHLVTRGVGSGADLATRDAGAEGISAVSGILAARVDAEVPPAPGIVEGLLVGQRKFPVFVGRGPRARLIDVSVGQHPDDPECALAGDGTFRFEDVPSGWYLVAVVGESTLRATSAAIEVSPGQTRWVTVLGSYSVMTEVHVTLGDRAGMGHKIRDGFVTFTELPDEYATQESHAIRRRIGGAGATFQLPLFRRRYGVVATFASSSTNVVLPTPTARTSFVVPEMVESPRVDVHLVLEPVRHQAVVRGRMALGEGESTGGFWAQATTAEGEDVEVRLKLERDGAFRLRVDLDQVSGPQFRITSRFHTDRLGPFVLGRGEVDLGVVQFREPKSDAVRRRGVSPE